MSITSPLHELAPEALHLIKEVAKWKWNPAIYGFISSYSSESPEQVTREELVENYLFGEVTSEKREEGLNWLREVLSIPVETPKSSQQALTSKDLIDAA